MRDTRSIQRLLILGGFIVVINYFVGALFEGVPWTEWAAASVLHMLGGGYAVFFVRALYRYAKARDTVLMPLYMEVMVWIGGALLLGVAWEWYELVVDRYSVWVLGERSLMTYADNIGDLMFDFLGAGAAALLLFARRVRVKV